MASTIWKGHLTFGLVSIPVKLVRAARAEKIHMHNLQRATGARVRQVFVTPDSDSVPVEAPAAQTARAGFESPRNRPFLAQPQSITPERIESPAVNAAIPKTELVRGFEYEKDKFVEFEREELEQIAPKTSSEMQIVEFVRFDEVDPVYLESSYYVTADHGGEKPYALLYTALKQTGYAALAEFVMHRRDQTMILRTGRQGMIGHTLFYEDEVRRENEFQADSGPVADRERDLAIKLVEALATPFEPGKFKDRYRERLQQAISEKIDSGTVRESAQVERKAPVVDLMAALKESLSQLKKPVKSELPTEVGKSLGKQKRAGKA